MLCQLKSYFGTFSIVSERPSGYSILYSKLLPRKCMCGIRLTIRIGVGNEKDCSSRWLGSFAGMLIPGLRRMFVNTSFFGGCLAKIRPRDERSCSTLPFGV